MAKLLVQLPSKSQTASAAKENIKTLIQGQSNEHQY